MSTLNWLKSFIVLLVKQCKARRGSFLSVGLSKRFPIPGGKPGLSCNGVSGLRDVENLECLTRVWNISSVVPTRGCDFMDWGYFV